MRARPPRWSCERGRPASCGRDFQAADIPMVMCGVCATIDRGAAGWDWRRHLELVLRGMKSEP